MEVIAVLPAITSFIKSLTILVFLKALAPGGILLGECHI